MKLPQKFDSLIKDEPNIQTLV